MFAPGFDAFINIWYNPRLGTFYKSGAHDGFPAYQVVMQIDNEPPFDAYHYANPSKSLWDLGGGLDAVIPGTFGAP